MPLQPIGSSTTPWVYNLDLKMDKRFNIAGYGLTVFARINNLLDRRNAINVYQATGSASDDGFYGNEVYVSKVEELCESFTDDQLDELVKKHPKEVNLIRKTKIDFKEALKISKALFKKGNPSKKILNIT